MEIKASHFLAALASVVCIGLLPLLPAAAEETAPADAAAEIIDSQVGWINANGKITYRFEDGHTASGETEIGGVYYLFSYSGTLKTDWQTVNGKRFYFDPATGQALFGWVDYFGSLYYVTEEDGKLTGTQEIDDMICQFDEDGVLQQMLPKDAPTVAETEAPTAEETTVETTEPLVFGNSMIAIATSEPVMEAAEQLIEEATEPVTEPVTEPETEPMIAALNTVAISTEPVTEAATAIAAEVPVQETEPEFIPPAEEPLPDEDPAPKLISEPEAASKPAATATKAAFELSVPDYKQKDPAWINAPLGNETIGQYGCLVTALAMVQSYAVAPCTPADMAMQLSFTSDGSLQKWDEVSALGYTIETYSQPVTTDILSKLYQLLSAGKPVILGSKGSWQHYVVVSGYTGTGTSFMAEDFIIHDPGYPNRVTLADHLASFETLYKLIYLS